MAVILFSSRCIRVLVSAALVFIFLSGPGFGQSPGKGDPQSPQGQGVYTPPKGSPERKAILDAVRQVLQRNFQVKAVFKVGYLKVQKGWALLYVNPKSPDGQSQYEPLWALLQKQAEAWKVVALPGVAGEMAEEDMTYGKLLQEVRASFPQAPPGIFPKDPDAIGR